MASPANPANVLRVVTADLLAYQAPLAAGGFYTRRAKQGETVELGTTAAARADALGAVRAATGPESTAYTPSPASVAIAAAQAASSAGGGSTTPTLPFLKAAPTGFGQPGSGRSAWAFNQALTNTNPKAKGFDSWWPVLDPTAPFVLPFGNQFVSQAGGAPDVEGLSPITLTAALVKNDGTKVPILFGGQATVTIGRGLPITWCDPVTIPAGALRTSNDVLGAAILGADGAAVQGVTIETYAVVPADVTRAASGVTSASPTITDSAADVAWTGRQVIGTGIPAAAYVVNVVPGVSYQLASNPTAAVPTLVNATVTGTPTLTLKAWIPANLNRYSQYDTATADNAADPTSTSGFVVGSAQDGIYGPMGLFVAPTTRLKLAMARTNSIGAGLSDSLVYTGPIVRAAVRRGLPLVKHSRGGQSAQAIVSLSGRRLQEPFLLGPTDDLLELLTNDAIFTNALGLQQAQDRLAQLVYTDRAAGVKRVAVCTVPPRTDGSNVPTAGAQASVLAPFNAWLRTKPLGIDYVLDLAALCEASAGSCTWLGGVGATTNVNGSTDGVHPAPWLMATTIAAAFDAWAQWVLAA